MTETIDVDDLFAGQPARVISVSLDHFRVDFRYPSGIIGSMTNTDNPIDFSVGDVLLVDADNNQCRKADISAWPEPTKIGVVRKILNTGILIDDNYQLQQVPNLDPDTVLVGQTVIFGDAGIHSKLSDTPVVPRHIDSGEDESDQHLWSPNEDELTFDDFGGYPDVVARARELIEVPLERADELESIGARPIKGVLFTGPPGTGKTHLARIIANQSKAAFYSISGPEVITKWVGDSEGKLRALFEHAARNKSSIIFFDEFDSLAEERTGDSHESSKRVVAQLLTLMDGFQTENSNIIVIAATNRPDDVDRALRRPGRFDWRIEFPKPSMGDRLAILQVSMRKINVKNPETIPLADIATKTEGWSAARLTLLWTEAALIAAADERGSLRTEDVLAAFQRLNGRPDLSEEV